MQLHFYPIQAGYAQWRTTIPVGRSNGLTASLLKFSAEAKRRISLDKLF
ncbi:hypothetical protein SAMN05444008_107248 [Cnuella takakiae]|uniref:Uncharacterized protein n=1 Tax=Cnuella takakiae TaxID=1302690 RepID=A0A1M5BCA1_9BACT|nr:hypothetical protein [Cnuella takakiae]SHF40058.1 hypothetical protein SAMN05444008_107248 [Cnuella takakiae]